MGTTHIKINHVRSRSPSVASEDDLHDTGVHVSPQTSPQNSIQGSQSQSESSEHPEERFVHLQYPNEIPGPELGPSDSASRLDTQRPPPVETSRSSSQRQQAPRSAQIRDPGRPPARELAEGSPTESIVSSAEEFARQAYQPPMPRPQSYYGNGGYAYSHSSDSYGHPQQMGPPPGTQMVHYAAPPPQPVPYAPPYSHMAPPTHAAYAPPSHHGYMPPMIHQAPSHVSSPYSHSPYVSPSVVPYGMPIPGYFPPQYPQPYPHPQFMDQYRVQSPGQSAMPPPTSAPPSEPEKPKVDQDELAKRIEAMLLEQRTERLKNEADREEILKAAKEEAYAQADRIANEQRIRDEATAAATAAALKQAADQAAAEKDRAAREQMIREEAAAAALKKAAEEAQAKADRATAEAQIAENAAAKAAAAAREEAEKKAAEAKKAADEKQEEAEKKLKEAEKAAADAKAEAEEAAKKAAANAPPDKKAHIIFEDAVNRKFNFPFEMCAKWRNMEHLIVQAFQHMDFAEHVMQGHYDLEGPSGEIIMPNVWDSVVEPGWYITMRMWPIPEKQEAPLPPPLDDTILNLDDILNPKKGKDKNKGKKDKKAKSGLSMWMSGGSSSKGSKSLKDDKKPDVAQHGTDGQGVCALM